MRNDHRCLQRFNAFASFVLVAVFTLLLAGAAEAQKPGVVLLPIQGEGLSRADRDYYRGALVEALAAKYAVFSGDDVDKKLEKFAKKTCNDEKCLQEMSIHYQAKFIGRGVINKEGSGYLILVELRDAFSDKVEFSSTQGCPGCDKLGVIEVLKSIVGGSVALAPPPVPAPPVRVTPVDDQTALWEAVQEGNTEEDYAAYLGTYPKGKYAPLAKSRMAKLKQEAADAAVRAEREAWEEAQGANTPERYGAYLTAYPDGKFARLAEVRQKKLAEDEAYLQEKSAWDAAEQSGQKADLQQYLDRYPGGRFKAAAQEKLAAIQKEEADMRPGKVYKDCAECPEMVIIPAGSYDMGSNDGDRDEKPVHRVSVPMFAMGKLEATRGQFAAFVRDSGHNAGSQCRKWTGSEWKESSGNWRDPGYAQDDSHPVACVNWDDAQAYVAWLAKKTGKPYRLPSEAEWEYAARAGSTTSRPWGNDADSACNYANVADITTKSQVPGTSGWTVHNCSDGSAYTAPVGKYKPNAFGLHDMIGNVSEWTGDCSNGNYNGAPTNGSAWTGGDCGRRVLRGGSWGFSPQRARSADRGRLTPGDRYYHFGFRVAAPFSARTN